MERDDKTRERILESPGGNRTVTMIYEEGKLTQVGWMGGGCYV